MYRNVQAGLRARANIVNKYKAHRYQEQKSFDALLSERTELLKYMSTMRYNLYKEEKAEAEMRWVLLRERAAHCAEGEESMCDYMNSSFLSPQELMDYSFQSSNPTRFVYQHTEQEVHHVRTLEGMRRVQASLCEATTLLPDEDLRIFTTVGDYLNFMASPGGKARRDTATRRKRHTRGVFNRYLADGTRGYTQLAVTASEWVGLVLSPLTLAMHLVQQVQSYTTQAVYAQVAQFNAQYHQHRSTRSSTLAGQAYEVLGELSQAVLAMDDEYSPLYQRYLRYLDYRQYPSLMAIADVLLDMLYYPQWIAAVAARAPRLYVEYYLYNGYRALPPRRQCCLLRSGLMAAEQEVRRLDSVIAARRAVIQAKTQALQQTQTALPVPPPSEDGPQSDWRSLLDTCVAAEIRGYNYSLCYFQSITQQASAGPGDKYSLGSFAHWGSAPPASSAAATRHPGPDVDDVYGVYDLLHNLYTLPSHLYHHTYRAMNLTEEGVQKARRVAQQLLGTQSRLEPYLDMLQQAVVAYNTSFHAASYSVAMSAQEQSVQSYRSGTGCGHARDGLHRSTLLHLHCGDHHSITSVEEVEVCRYEIHVSCPLACSVELEQVQLEELDRLGIFGFSKPKKKP
jgi:hypothetical protein